MTGCDAHLLGFQVVVPEGGVASPKNEDARQALDLLKRAARAKIGTSERVDWGLNPP